MKRRQPLLVAARHPLRFAWESAKAFKANQGLLLAGAVAYYALLSIVPLLILTVLTLSRFIEEGELLATVGRYLEWLLPGQSDALVAELSNFLLHRDVLGPVLLVTLLFFSSLAFTVLEREARAPEPGTEPHARAHPEIRPNEQGRSQQKETSGFYL